MPRACVVKVFGFDLTQGCETLLKTVECKDLNAADRVAKAWRLQGNYACIIETAPPAGVRAPLSDLA